MTWIFSRITDYTNMKRKSIMIDFSLKSLLLIYIFSLLPLVKTHESHDLFCWKFEATPYEYANVSGNIIYWNYLTKHQLTDLQHRNTLGKGIACTPDNMLQLKTNCWNFEPDTLSKQEHIDYILELFFQFEPILSEAIYINYSLNRSEPICFVKKQSDCRVKNSSHFVFNFSISETFNRKNLYTFNNRYNSSFNGSRICFLPFKFYNIISCLEKPAEDIVTDNPKTFMHSNFKRQTQIIKKRNWFCVPSAPKSNIGLPTEMPYILTTVFTIYLFFLGIFLLECLLIPNLRKYPKCIIMYLSLSLFLGKVLFMTIFYTKLDSQYLGCFIILLFYRIFSLSSYFWLGISGYDMWTTFNNIDTKESLLAVERKLRMLYYFIFVWGFSISIAISEILTLYFAPEGSGFNYISLTKSCASWTTYTQNLFYSLPTAIILLTNVVFFCLTLKNIKKSQRNQVVHHGTKNTFLQVLSKLLILFGFPWILSIISDIVNIFYESPALYYAAVFLSGSQGFFIWYFFGFSQTIREKLKYISWQILSDIQGHVPQEKSPKVIRKFTISK